MKQRFHRFLIVRTDRIGDVVLTLPMASVIRKQNPDAHIAMLIQQYTSELAARDQNISDILTYDEGGKVLPFFTLIENIRRGNYDVVFHTHPRFRLALITWLAGVRERVGTGYRWYSFLFTRRLYEHRKDARFHELEYNIHLISCLGYSIKGIDISPRLTITQEAEKRISEYILKLNLPKDKKIVILHPGSGSSARDWNPVNFGLLGEKLQKLEDVQVVITGGRHEKYLVELVRSVAGEQAIGLSNELSIGEFAAFIKKAHLFVANSTGPIHIAAAVGTPIIGFYPHITALSEQRWGPWTEKKIIFSPQDKPVNCRKCIKSRSMVCECMDSIKVDAVFEVMFQMIQKIQICS